MKEPLLQIENLSVTLETMRGPLKAVNRVGFHVLPGENLGVVGESGCGKSMTSLGLLDLLPPKGVRQADLIKFDGTDITNASESTMRSIRGGEIAMIFQDAITSLNPSFTVGFQLIETLAAHNIGNSKSDRSERAKELLVKVGIPDPEQRLRAYPHQLSGGMCQRVMIAMAIACEPKLLIADEPTTALDVTIQAQILGLLSKIQRECNMSLILITHDIGVVSEIADRILVMYAGEVIESGPTTEIIEAPKHPYTKALLNCLPDSHKFDKKKEGQKVELPSIPGMVPDLVNPPKGCPFHPRCELVKEDCSSNEKYKSLTGTKCLHPL
jgi:oligopeptide/dipeptide ABC transporter ATP-binding protein